MKKGCFIRQDYFPGCVRLRKEALALAANGYEIDVICLKNEHEPKREIIKGINVYRLNIKQKRSGLFRYFYEYFFFFCIATIKICSLYLRKRYDFIQVNTLPDFLVFTTIIPKLFGAKVILDLHEPTPELFATIFGNDSKIIINLVKFVQQMSIRYANRSITVSEQLKNSFIKRGASPSKIDVVLNVPNLEFNPNLYKNDLKKNHSNFLLICHGAMLKRYGQETAIKAIDIVKKKIPNIRLNIMGYGQFEPELKRLASQLKLENYVYFWGYIPYLDLIKTIAKSDVGIVPVEKNAYSDLVHTNKMFEFIAMKRPVIISRTKAVEDFFGSDDSCLKYFESGNEKDLARCIIELYHSPGEMQKMVNNASAKFESVSWEITKNKYCQIVDNLFNN